jgi:hypothetical protein
MLTIAPTSARRNGERQAIPACPKRQLDSVEVRSKRRCGFSFERTALFAELYKFAINVRSAGIKQIAQQFDASVQKARRAAMMIIAGVPGPRYFCSI